MEKNKTDNSVCENSVALTKWKHCNFAKAGDHFSFSYKSTANKMHTIYTISKSYAKLVTISCTNS